MATYELIAPMPMYRIEPGMKIVLEAIDPATGAAVTSVGASAIAIYATPLAGDQTELTTVPQWVYGPPPASGGTEAPGLTPG